MEDQDAKLKLLILALQAKFGRLPTESEVVEFIEGDREVRTSIWNQTKE